MRTSRARLPKKLTFEPGDYVLKSSRRNIQYGDGRIYYWRAGASQPSRTTGAIFLYTSKLKILQIIMWNIGMAQKAKETRSGCLVHIVQ